MSEPHSLEEQIRRGKGMERIVEDPLFREAMADARESLIAKWERATTPVEREKIHATLLGLQEMQLSLRKMVDAGKHAAIELQRASRQPI